MTDERDIVERLRAPLSLGTSARAGQIIRERRQAADRIASLTARVGELEGVLRQCLSDYSHPRFTDRHGMADRIRAALEGRGKGAQEQESKDANR